MGCTPSATTTHQCCSMVACRSGGASRLSGHSDPGFTLRIYAHLMPDSEDRARAVVDAAFRAPAQSPRNTGTARPKFFNYYKGFPGSTTSTPRSDQGLLVVSRCCSKHALTRRNATYMLVVLPCHFAPFLMLPRNIRGTRGAARGVRGELRFS
jgi:hypothetical protein